MDIEIHYAGQVMTMPLSEAAILGGIVTSIFNDQESMKGDEEINWASGRVMVRVGVKS